MQRILVPSFFLGHTPAPPCRTIGLRACLLLLLCCVFLLPAGCSREPSDAGVVARVNGRPIYLHQLEAKYDLSHLGWSGSVSPSLGKLKEDYNRILSELIAQELIFQVLKEKGIPVSEEELLQAEAKVRTDYPKGMFEQVLVEEYIDLEVWRQQLHAHLAYEKFLTKILRPRISVDPAEAEAYYAAHLSAFSMPARVGFVLFTGPTAELVQSALDMFRGNGDIAAVTRAFAGVEAQEIKLLQDRLTTKWSKALEGVEEGGASRVLTAQSGFEALALLERRPAQQLDFSEAQPLVEKILLEQKLHDAFAAWLENELKESDIFVSRQLLAAEGDEEVATEPLLPLGRPEGDTMAPLPGTPEPGAASGEERAEEETLMPGEAEPLGEEEPLGEGELGDEVPHPELDKPQSLLRAPLDTAFAHHSRARLASGGGVCKSGEKWVA